MIVATAEQIPAVPQPLGISLLSVIPKFATFPVNRDRAQDSKNTPVSALIQPTLPDIYLRIVVEIWIMFLT